MTELRFTPPTAVSDPANHHALAAAANTQATAAATEQLEAALAGSGIERILLKAAAGAGKSFALRGMVATALDHWRCQRVCVAAFTNKQIELLAEGLGRELGRDKVCLYTSDKRLPDVPQSVRDAATVEPSLSNIPPTAQVILATSHKLGFTLRNLTNSLGSGANGATVFDALFVDEAWQLAHHLYEPIQRAAPVVVGVGDVGQLPPLEIGRPDQGGGLQRRPVIRNTGATLNDETRQYSTRAARKVRNGTMADGVVGGVHYIDHVETVKGLKREGRLDEAIDLLRGCADAAEDEAAAQGLGVAPWYFEQLALCFAKQKDTEAELEILDRFLRLPHAPGAGPGKLAARESKLRARLGLSPANRLVPGDTPVEPDSERPSAQPATALPRTAVEITDSEGHAEECTDLTIAPSNSTARPRPLARKLPSPPPTQPAP